MVPFSSKISGHIRFLFQSLNDSNYDAIFAELCKMCSTHGMEGSILLLQTCLDFLNIREKDLNNVKLLPLYASILRHIMDKPNFSTVISESLRDADINEDFLLNFCGSLHLSGAEKIGIGLALSNSENYDIRMHGKHFCVGQIAELCANPLEFESSYLIQDILMFLRRSSGLCMHLDSFMQMLSLLKLEGSHFILAPLVCDELREENFFRNLNLLNGGDEDDFDSILAEMEKDISMADVISELGYGCTVNTSQCKETLSLFLPLYNIKIAQILGTIAGTYAGLDGSQNLFATFHAAIGGESFVDIASLDSWNVDVLVDTINQLAPGINWINVVENLDHEGFYIPNETAFSFFMSVYKHACQDPFPLRAICGFIWKNVEGQLSFLKYAVSAQPEVFTFAHCGRQLLDENAGLGFTFQPGQVHDAWLCLDLLEILCQLSELGHACFVRDILEKPLNQYPEVLLLGMAHVNTSYNLIQNEVALAAIPELMKSTMRNSLFYNLWRANPHMLIRGILEAINLDPGHISSVLDVCEELKIVSAVLDMIPFYFGIRLAVVASKNEIIELEAWLSDHLMRNKDAFYEECVMFVKDFCAGPQDVSTNQFHSYGPVLNTYFDASLTVLKVLQSHNGVISSSHLSEEMEKLDAAHIRTTSRIKNAGGPESVSDNFAEEIETESNSYFHRMFSNQLPLDQMIQMLTDFKDSLVKREQLIFDCMIANLFEEYKFFSKYPDMQLRLAANLFGSLIKFQLVTHLPLGIALRAVLDALRKPADSKMFTFGTVALQQFVDRLTEWPQYCNHILQISHLRTLHPELVTLTEIALNQKSTAHNEPDVIPNVSLDNQGPAISTTNVEFTGSTFSLIGSGTALTGLQVSTGIQPAQRVPVSLDERKAPTTPSNYYKQTQPTVEQPARSLSSEVAVNQKASNSHVGVGVPAMPSANPGFSRSSRATSARFGSALNIETLVAAAERRDTSIEVPASEIQDKISFIINNLSAANVEAKAEEFSDILVEQYYPWFAQYLVMKRASIETNFHDLYLKFLDKVNLKPLSKHIVKATYENCKVLLGSELIKSSVEERSLLKNLGSWLGKITIGKNRVLLAREIDPKPLIIEAYEKGLMIAVIPFTSKILEPCSSSIVYQPPNPWTMAILGLLAEIYAMRNLKMNLKFEIEVLFKNLGVDLKDVPPTSLLKDRVREVEGNPDFSIKDLGPSQPPVINDVKSGIIFPVNQVECGKPLHHPSGALAEEEKLVSLEFSDQLPSAHGLLNGQTQFSVNQLPVPAPSIEQQIVVNEKIQAVGLHSHFQRVLPMAMDRAVKEIVSSIVQRSVSIATQTTKELVLKDYAMEPDEILIRKAAHLMVARLAGSLAHVTCKEPLRSSISAQLRSTLQGLSLSSELLDSAVQIVTNDNLDLGCVLIEQAATEKAVQTIDGDIAQQLPMRRKPSRENIGHPLFAASMYAQGQMGILLEALRPKPGHMSHSQQRVYEDFARFPGHNRPSQNSNTVPVGSSSSGNDGLSKQFGSASGPVGLSIYSSGIVNPGLGAVPQTSDVGPEEIDSAAVQIPTSVTSIHKSIYEDPQTLENNAVASFPPSNPDLLEAGTPAQPINPAFSVDGPASSVCEALLSTGDALEKYQIISEKLENLLASNVNETEIQGAISEVPAIILRCISRDEAALAVAQKAFKGLYEHASNGAHVDAHLAILAVIREVSKLVVKELTSWVIYSEEDRKFNKDITIGLIQSDLLNLAEYNVHMAKLTDAGRNKAATEFAISLIKALIPNNVKVISELQNLVDALAKIAARPGSPESLQQLVEMAKNPSNSGAFSPVSVGKEDSRIPKDIKAAGIPGRSREDYNATEFVDSDPASFQEKVSNLFGEWCQIWDLLGISDAVCANYVLQLQQRGLLEGDETSDRFFRKIMDVSVSHCLSSEVINSNSSLSQQGHTLSFLAIDIFSKLVFSVLKFYRVEGSSKLSLLPKVLAVIVKFVQKDTEEKRVSFNPRPYFRLFINWIHDLPCLDPVFEGANFQVLTALANAFHALQPLKVPGFCFAWLELISHRSFMPKLLTANSQKGWPYLQRLLVDLFQFMEPFLRNAELGEPVHFLYKGTLRVLLVLLHDFPEFLCDYHLSFCDVIPPSCIQMRNIILSAFPRNMRLPDPSTPNLKIDLLTEIGQSPRILSEVDAALKAKLMKNDVDEYLKTRQHGSSFLAELKHKLLLSPTDAARAGTRYNAPVINSLVLYVGMQQLQAKPSPHSQPLTDMNGIIVSAALDIFQSLISDIDTEGRYLFLNAIANQLRYPNNHTHFFSFIILCLFSEAHQREMIQEQITRVLLERLIVNRPHPWGLLITFIELIKNPLYKFWSRAFTRCAPEIEKLFESVSRSCGGQKTVDDTVVPDSMH